MGKALGHNSKSTRWNLLALGRLSEEEARLRLAEFRWGSSTEQVCPDCGQVDSHYVRRARKQWECKGCRFTFSVTTRTPLAYHKIDHRHILVALRLFEAHAKGEAALVMQRLFGGDYRTWFTLLHKIRDAFTRTVPLQKLSGLVEIDAGYFSGAIRSMRKRRYKKKSRQNRRAAIVMREKNDGKKEGAGRTVTIICRSENPKDIAALITMWVEPGSTIRTDDHPAYRSIPRILYKHEVVNHKVEFSSDTGVNENQCESFFSRMRRSQTGIYHRITRHYMIDYANEMVWHEEVRHMDTEARMRNLVRRVFNAGRSPDWSGYSHGHRRQKELLFAA